MAVIPVPQPKIDALIDFPVEVEGSPILTVDEQTFSLHIKRNYAVRSALWQKLAFATPDPRFTDARLITEAGGSIQGPVLFFTRNFSQIPASRTQPREIAFTLPGRSAVVFSEVTHLPIGWNPYGAVAPQTVPLDAQVLYEYAAVTSLSQDPATAFAPVAVSALTYQGARVDYSGVVYAFGGDVSLDRGPGQPPLVEPRWRREGVVGWFTSGVTWVVSTNITQWRGPIYQREVVRIPNFVLP